MSQLPADEPASALSLAIVPGPALAARLAEARCAALAQEAVARAVAGLLATLGLPGRPAVTFSAEHEPPPDGRPLELHVEGRLCPCPDELLLLTYSYSLGRPLAPGGSLGAIEPWLAGAAEHELAAWLAATARLALGRRAGALLGPPRAAEYIASLPPPSGDVAWPPDNVTLGPLLAEVLALGISLDDRATVAETLARMGEATHAALREELITALRPPSLELSVEPAYLRELTADGARLHELFIFMLDGMFVELGMIFPPLQLRADPTLKPRAFALTINHLRGPCHIGLVTDQILVNDSAGRLQLMEIAGEDAGNPASYYPACIAPAAHKEQLESAGYTTWDMLGYLILALAEELRHNSGHLIERTVVGQMLEQLEKAFPALTGAAGEQIAGEALVETLRALTAEQVSIRDLRGTLERLLEYELFVAQQDPSMSRLDFVRAGMRDAIAHKLSRATQTLVTYLLEPQLEQALGQPLPPSAADDLHRQVVSALRKELDWLPDTAAPPVILTTAAARAQLRPILAAAMPRLAIVSYGDIPPERNIQPVARIALP
jgi:hypothetical protein